VQRVENPMNYVKSLVGILKSGRVCMERGKTDKEERALLEATREKLHET
jgi:hypothetical protein